MPPRFCLCVVAVLSGCRIDPSGGPPFSGSAGAEEPGAEVPPPEPPSAGGASASSGGSRGTSPPSSSGGGSDDEPPGAACDAESVELDEVRSELVLPGVSVVLVATATSQKFLVSQSGSGSCLWGAFFGAEPRDGEPRGLLVVSYGDEAAGEAGCEPGTDAIPDDLTPGDRARVVGRASSFAPSSCTDATPAPQMIADARCPLERIERATPIEPVPLPFEVADELSHGTDPELVRRWSGGLARLENVSALANDSGDGAVRPYGVIALAETTLEVHADIEYGDLSAGGPRDASKGLDFPYPTPFRSITGLVYLDYCTFALAPRKRCSDFDPPSSGCP